MNGVFNQRLIRKTTFVDLPESAATDMLLSMIADQLNLKGTLDGSPLVLLNGRRIDSNDVHLSEGDTLSLLSPLTGG